MAKRGWMAVIGGALIAMPAMPGTAQPARDRLAPLSLSAPQGDTITVTARPLRIASPDVFGTVALDAGVTVYGARWRRVSNADAADPRLAAMMVPASGLDPLAKMAFVQSTVRRRIAWRRDLDGYRVSDYWAQAGETLDRGYGDAEDIAVLKMQALKAAGFNARDFYLSVGRDSARGLDTLLLVRVGSHFYALDDRSDLPLTDEEHARFVPVITLGKDIAWLHGKRTARAAAGYSRAKSRLAMAR